MSAPAPALVPAPARVVRIRLADPALAAANLSLVFAVLLVCFPVSFPRMIVENWLQGRLTLLLAVLSCSLNGALYLWVAHLRRAKLGFLTSAFLGSMTVVTVLGSSVLQTAALAGELKSMPNPQACADEMVVANTYFALIAGVFLPYLLIRFAQNLRNNFKRRRP